MSAAIDPNDPNTIVAGADSWVTVNEGIGPGALPVGIFKTRDGGANWSMSTLPWNSWPALRPQLAMGLDGSTYAGWTVGPCCGPHPARDTPVVSRSADQGASWTTPVEPAPNAVWPSGGPLAVDQTTSPYRNRVYAAYADAAGPEAQNQYQSVLLGRSDNGTTWSSFTVKTSTALGPTNRDPAKLQPLERSQSRSVARGRSEGNPLSRVGRQSESRSRPHLLRPVHQRGDHVVGADADRHRQSQ